MGEILEIGPSRWVYVLTNLLDLLIRGQIVSILVQNPYSNIEVLL
jgi:hypothetical protein